jgi:archaellum component FlaC
MNKDKIESEIKELNAIRAMHHRDFKEFEKRYDRKEISDKSFEKHKQKYDSRIEKIKDKIRKLEEKHEEKE